MFVNYLITLLADKIRSYGIYRMLFSKVCYFLNFLKGLVVVFSLSLDPVDKRLQQIDCFKFAEFYILTRSSI